MQTTNLMGLGEGKRTIERAGGWGGIGASGHTSQQTRDKKNVTFIGPCCRLREKEPKKVLFTRLRRNKKQKDIRIERACRGVGGSIGHLLHVETGLKTYRNLKNLAAKPKKKQPKRKSEGADKEFNVVRGGEKGH